MKGFCIRTGAAEDVAGVISLERAAVKAPHWTAAEYAAVVANDSEYVSSRLFVAESEGELIGFAVGKALGGIAELETVAVDLQARRCGVGNALCKAIINWGSEQGAVAVELEVRVGSNGAIGLYRRLGFVPVGRRPGYYSDPVEDAVLMRLDLTESP